MGKRIEVRSKIADARAVSFVKNLASFGHQVSEAEVIDVYTVNKELPVESYSKISALLCNPVTEEAAIDAPTDIESFDWAVEIGYLPGVTDNVAGTVKVEIGELLKIKF